MGATAQSPRRGAAFRFFSPIIFVAIAIFIHLLLLRFLPRGTPFPYPFLYATATCFAAWYGGYLAGVLACVIPVVIIPLALRPFYPTQPLNLVGLAQLIVIALLISRTEQVQRREREALRLHNEELDRRVLDRTQQLDLAVEQLLSEISGHQRAEAALRESEERIEFALEAAGVGRLDLDLKTGLAERSLRHDQIFGYESLLPEWSYTQLLAHVVPEDQPIVAECFETAIASASTCEFECRIQTPDGAIRWISIRGKIRRNRAGRTSDSAVSMLGIVADITESKLAEQKLRTQLGRMSLLDQLTRSIGERQDMASVFQVVIGTLEDNLPVDFGCICLYDPTAEMLTVSSIGFRGEALASDLDMRPAALIPIDKNGLSRCVGGQLVYESDLSNVAFPFPERLARAGLLSMVAAPLVVESQVFGVLIAARRTRDGFSSGECEFLRQVSEHVALGANQAQMYSALQRAYDDLRQTQQAAMQQERLRALGQMASGIAHDINNAISPVAVYTESLLETEPNLSQRTRQYLETIQRAIGDVAQTVARMGEFYRQAKPQLTLTPVDLGRVIQQVLDLTRARWSDIPQRLGQMIHVRIELAPALPLIAGVESEIREALTNLIFNALDAMPEGGTLTLRTIAPATNDSGYVDVEVGDTGIGMDEETRRRCLEPFFTTKGERGTGLGLAMVYGIVQRHSAVLEIDSEVALGTIVRLRFLPAAVSGEQVHTVSQNSIPGRMRILVVDDDPLVIKSLRDTLEFDGHLVVTANGGKDGIATFQAAYQTADRFAAIVTDLGMPDVDGRKVASAIKLLSPTTPVILLTGWGQRLVAEEGLPENVNFVLNKPPKLRDLRAALAELTRGS
jgi:PAS domain S-box-containing protein